MDDQKQIRQSSDKIIEKFAAKKIILFGSYAYGEPNKDSDIDLCVIADFKGKRKIDIIREIRREIISFITFPLDIFVYDLEEFDERSELRNTLEYKIAHEGKLIYE